MPELHRAEDLSALDEATLLQMESECRAMQVTGSARITEGGIHLTIDGGTIRGDLFIDKDEFTAELGATRVIGFIATLPKLFAEGLAEVGCEIVEEDDESSGT